VDANRSPANAYLGPAGEPYYRAYHERAEAFVREIVQSRGRGLLIDLHGCCQRRSGVRNPDALYRGTRKGQSVALLLARHGTAAVTGPQSVFGQLRSSGYQVWPELSLGPAHETILQGGYTLERYGSHNGGLDALQIEVGWNLRREPSARRRLADDLGRAVAVFYTAYLLE
jgi:N-formylglutamate amidohydrolase